MATKKSPGKFDCYARAKDDEPHFVLLARDPDFARLVTLWADKREQDVLCGERPQSDMEAIGEARKSIGDAQAWRLKNKQSRDSKGHW